MRAGAHPTPLCLLLLSFHICKSQFCVMISRETFFGVAVNNIMVSLGQGWCSTALLSSCFKFNNAHLLASQCLPVPEQSNGAH